MKRHFALLYLLSVGLLLASCNTAPQEPVSLSVIGSSSKIADPASGVSNALSRNMLGATAQSLVSFDTSDRVQPALAERWILTDDGLSYIFRLREAHWPDGAPVTSADVAASLRRSMALSGKNALRAMFFKVKAVIPMTGQVIEIRLNSPEPNLLQLLAQPEMAILLKGMGTGPFVAHSRKGNVVRIRPSPATFDEGEQAPVVDVNRDVRIYTERAAQGLARFNTESISYLAGGTFADLPLVRASGVDAARFQLDPTYGLFGLGIAEGSKPLSSEAARLALSLAIDRESLTQRFGVSDWQPALSILPTQLDSDSQPAAMLALQRPLSERRVQARSMISGQKVGGKPLQLNLWLPGGEGSRLLFASLSADWRRVGIEVHLVSARQNADLFLIDEVAPVSSGLWYLERLSCGHGLICVQNSQKRLIEAMAATDLIERHKLIGVADAALVSSNVYIPLAMPLRWSLVGPELVRWRKSVFAVHSLSELR